MIGQDTDAAGLEESVRLQSLDVCQAVREGGFYEGVSALSNGLFMAARRESVICFIVIP